MKNTAIVLFTILTTTLSHASVYEFGGSCPSRGEWTQKALQQTAELKQVINNLKDNPKCKGLANALTNLKSAEIEIKPQEDEATQERIESIPAETEALRDAALNPETTDPKISSMLLKREMEAASINSDLSLKTPKVGGFSSMTKKNVNFGAILSRLKRPVSRGLDIVSNVMKVIPDYDECLIGQPSQGLAIMTGVVQIAASFSASGEGVGTKLAKAIAGYMEMLRERKFTTALRGLDQTEFWLSMSCLIETTAKNYCDAENAELIMKYSQDRYKETRKRNLQGRENPHYNNPLEGYYLLVRELPTISSWLQKVQFGVKPKLSTDAAFKNRVWEEVVEQTKKINELYGYFSEQMLFMRELKGVNAKRNHLVSVLEHLAQKMGGGADGEYVNGSKFFTTTVNDLLMPYYLIGMENVPSETMNMQYSMGREWSTWMKNGGANNGFVASFNDPEKLAVIIENRMDSIIGDASEKASEYFRQRLVVDMPDLVNKTLSSQYLTVKKAFENVLYYLNRFENKLALQSNDPTEYIMLPSVRETRNKIKKFLASYQKLIDLGQKVAMNAESPETLSDSTRKAAEEVIMTAFNEFNMIYQKDTFLTTRLSTFIERDFAKALHSGTDMSKETQDILTIHQKDMMDKLVEIHGINPATADQDLASAQMANKRNLEGIERVFTDSLYRMMVEMKAVAEGTGLNGVATMLFIKLNREAEKLYNQSYTITKIANLSLSSIAGNPLFNLYHSRVIKNHPDLYQEPVQDKIMGSDTRFGAYKNMLAKVCIQTLAFENRRDFWELCRGTVLESYYTKAGVTGLDVKYDDYIHPFKNMFKKPTGAETSKNICAYNQFNIKNLVHMLKDQDKELYGTENY